MVAAISCVGSKSSMTTMPNDLVNGNWVLMEAEVLKYLSMSAPKGNASGIPAQILKNTEQIAYKNLVQNLNRRNSSLCNSIAFDSAPGREADSQPISQLVRPAVSQAVSWASRQADRQTETHSLGIFSGGLAYKQRGARYTSDKPAVQR